ncbi:helicase associated domain-containing protein [Streptomyces sp. NPDC006552]|uniref:helicase associated domain-containing protein n=1 Tax=Streptomyces sp. NPDC006552 TaxID=3157179 RepID=UPI0033A6E25F
MRRTQDDKWNLDLSAAHYFHAREGHLNVPRKHTEVVPLAEAGRSAHRAERVGEGVPVALGMFLANTRRRADKLTVRRRDDLDQFGMRW